MNTYLIIIGKNGSQESCSVMKGEKKGDILIHHLDRDQKLGGGPHSVIFSQKRKGGGEGFFLLLLSGSWKREERNLVWIGRPNGYSRKGKIYKIKWSEKKKRKSFRSVPLPSRRGKKRE